MVIMPMTIPITMPMNMPTYEHVYDYIISFNFSEPQQLSISVSEVAVAVSDGLMQVVEL